MIPELGPWRGHHINECVIIMNYCPSYTTTDSFLEMQSNFSHTHVYVCIYVHLCMCVYFFFTMNLFQPAKLESVWLSTLQQCFKWTIFLYSSKTKSINSMTICPHYLSLCKHTSLIHLLSPLQYTVLPCCYATYNFKESSYYSHT